MAIPDQASVKIAGNVLMGDASVLQTASEHDDAGSKGRENIIEDPKDVRHARGKVPLVVWLLAFTGAAQRFAYYGTTIPWQNYLQNELGMDPPGVLGLGQAKATILNNAFLFLSYLAPLPLAIVSDSWLGGYRTLILSLIIFVIGEMVLVLTALPSVASHHGIALGGFITAMILIAIGQGGTSAVIFPFLGDQIPDESPQRVCTKTGESVVVDRKLTVQYVFNTFYWMINIAALSTLATTMLERKIGFWVAYLLPLCFLGTSMLPILMWNSRLTKLPPQGTVLPHASRVFTVAIRAGFDLNAADPLHQTQHSIRTVPWSSHFVKELRRGLRACRVILCFTIYYLCFNQSMVTIISQANQMNLSGISNDTVQSFNAIAYIILNPLIQHCLFPFLAQHRIALGPIARMTIAFILMAMAMAYASGIQKLVYSRGPCFSHPLLCDAAITIRGGNAIHRQPNDVSIWIQVPLHVLLAASEIFGFVALNEFAYSEAPTNMKALVKAFEQLTAAVGAGLGMALGPVSKDPLLVAVFAALGGTMFLSGVLFYAVFRAHDRDWQGGGSTEDLHTPTEAGAADGRMRESRDISDEQSGSVALKQASKLRYNH